MSNVEYKSWKKQRSKENEKGGMDRGEYIGYQNIIKNF